MKRFATIMPALLLLPLLAFAADEEDVAPGFNEKTFEGLAMRSIGPAFMSGRIADIAIHPDNRSHWYVGVGSGGVWKTVNAGTTWQPVFDSEGSYSIGCVTIDPNRPDTVWVGTGENVSGRHVGYGDGVYRSLDAGKSWTRMGLEDSEHIGMIRVDPRDSSVVYVAAQGPLWSGGGERGLYKTVDGGESWEKVLGGGDYTGVNEIHLDPANPDVMYAVTWQRFRNVAGLMDGGPETGIHKSIDGGYTWRELTEGLPEENMGKTGIAISPIRPNVVYAAIELKQRTGGVFRSEDGGETWEKRSDFVASGTGPHYYQEIFASPHEFDLLYHMDVYLHVSDDGGKTFVKTEYQDKHVDHHAMAFDLEDPDYLLVGNDGGVYESLDRGENWRFAANLPVTQFYKVSVDYDEPFYNVYGGTQDSNTQGGPSRTRNVHGILNSDWFVALGGDGHQPAADPNDPDIVYAQWQQGNLTRFDRRTGESVYIKPQPEKGAPTERFNWDAPILISPHDSSRLYFASQRVWRSDDRGDSWRAISGDLSRGIDRIAQPMMGRVWSFDEPWDLYAMSKYGTITSLSESPIVDGLLYAGTDDGLIHVSEDGGRTWRSVDDLPGVPEFFFVNDIKADLFQADTVYVVVDDHKSGDFSPFVLKSSNRGRSWRSITGDLPERHIVWRLVQDHENPDLLFLGTEFGVFFSVQGGNQWVKLSGGVPNIPFRDLAIQKRENDLVGATFGRGFYVLDDYTPLRRISTGMLESQTVLFPVRDARWYVPKRPLGCSSDGCKASQGAALFQAPNPPFGATFTYYLPEQIFSLQERRREREKPLEETGKDTPYPGWDALQAEALEDEPAMVLTVTDSRGNVVRHIEGPVTAGFNRVAWDLRYPAVEPWVPEEQREPSREEPAGVLVEPGTYTVQLARRIDGRLEDTDQSQTFDVTSIRNPTLTRATQAQRVAFSRRVDELRRAVSGSVSAIDELIVAIDAVKEVVTRSTADASLYDEANSISQRAKVLRDRLTTNEARAYMGDPGPVAVDQRLDVAGFGALSTAYGPTVTQSRSLEIADEQFAEIGRALNRLIDSEFGALKEKLDAAGVPWTPGRGVPNSE
ncbi:MAG: glycosyl hydrolase [Gammaproteobacteria bacterium]